MSKVRNNASEIEVGDVFKASYSDNKYEIVHILEGGKHVVYKKPSGSGYGVTKGEVFTPAQGDYKLVLPFFEEGKVYAYKSRYSDALGSDRYKILSVAEYGGKLAALYVEASSEGDEWFGSFTQGDYKTYGNEVSV